jgi:hypothetical protein
VEGAGDTTLLSAEQGDFASYVITVTRAGDVMGYDAAVLTHPFPQHSKGNMTISQTPSSVAERRLSIARRLYEALVTQDPNRAITLRDSGGGVVARHSPPRPEQGDPAIQRLSDAKSTVRFVK